MAALDSLAELNSILEEWNNENATVGFATSNPVPKIKRLAEIVERETEAYYKMDPDPFDDRHPGRANPNCTLGHLFKALFKNEEFMNRLVSSYVLHAQRDLQIQTLACRLLYDILPGLETSVVFQETEGLVEQLLKWAEKADEPLRTYATGLLAGAMELQDVAANFKEKNSTLVSIMLQRLHSLQTEMHQQYLKEETEKAEENKRNFAMFDSPSKSAGSSKSPSKSSMKSPSKGDHSHTSVSKGVNCSESTSKGDNLESSTFKEGRPPTKKTETLSAIEEETECSLETNKRLSCEKGDVNSDSKQVVSVNSVDKKDVTTEMGETEIKESDKHVDLVVVRPVKVSYSQTPCSSKDCADLIQASVDTVKQVEDRLDLSDLDSEDEERKEEITVEDRRARIKRALSPSFHREEAFQMKRPRLKNDSFIMSDVSNSSWADLQPYVIGSYSLEPLTLGMKQRLILQYLTPMGEYQELISAAFEHRAMDLVFYYINLKYNRDVRLAFEALKYLAVLLCHKKFAIEFLNRGGVQKLLDVYRPSIAATGVSLCLYYLSYFEDAMERVCLLPDHTLTTLVNYVLWLLECSHDSSRCHAAMFFTQSFPFVVILNRFDSHDGLRRLFNVISTLEILNMESTASLSEDQVFTMRQSARHVCVALKRYFEAHLILKVNELKRSHVRNGGGSPYHETPPYKAIKITPEIVQENMEIMMELMPVRQHWQPEETFFKLGGITLLCQLVGMSPEWPNYTGKPETLKAALDVIALCCVTPKSQLHLCNSIPMPENVKTPAVSILVGIAEGEVLPDPDVQKSALSVIINCVCGPIERLGGGVGRFMGAGSKKKINLKLGEDVLSKMWNAVRINNGIMVLLKLLSVKTPIIDADSIRALACKALVGMARSETVRQIISKLPLFTSGQIQSLMKEPVLQDKRQEHVKFCRYATELIEKVSGKQSHRYSDASLDDIRKADIVAQSKIIYNEKELLQLIYDHLQSKGYHEAADALHKEANLPRCVTPPPVHPANLQVFPPSHSTSPSGVYSPNSSAIYTPRTLTRQLSQPVPMPGTSSFSSNQNLPVTTQASIAAVTTSAAAAPAAGTPSSSHFQAPQTSQPSQTHFSQSNIVQPTASQMSPSGARVPGSHSAPSHSSQLNSTHTGLHQQGASSSQSASTPTGHIRFSMSKLANHQNQHLTATPGSSSSSLRNLQNKCRFVRERESNVLSPAVKKGLFVRSQMDYEMSLDKIVTEYLRKQHALCRNPVVTCPPMSLFHPHQCPEPRGHLCAPMNFTTRMFNKAINPKYGGFDGCKLDRKFIYSRFKAIRTYKESEEDGFSCCTFAPSQQYLMLGTYGGNLKLINTQSTEETGSFRCHTSPVTHCEHSRDGKLVITASSYGIMYGSALWSWGAETLDKGFDFEDQHLEFSRHVQDRLIGTKDETASVYDIVTGERILRLYDADKANNYKANRAVFNPTDDLVLNDGVLWDIRMPLAIHKFDKFNQYVSGVFHPIGLEIIINSEVWDIRSFRLLHTVPALDQCQIRFNYLGDVMYATRIEEELEMDMDRYSPYGSTFRTFDTTNYAAIATMDVKSRSISDLCTDTVDTFLAVVENQQSTDMGSEENFCRLYEIGKVKVEDDDQQNEEEEERVEEDDDDDDDDDDNEDDFLLADDEENEDDEDNEEGDNEENSGENDDIEDDTEDDSDDDEAILSLGSDEDDEDDDDDDADFDLDGAYFELADL